jgi:hypothetical protein
MTLDSTIESGLGVPLHCNSVMEQLMRVPLADTHFSFLFFAIIPSLSHGTQCAGRACQAKRSAQGRKGARGMRSSQALRQQLAWVLTSYSCDGCSCACNSRYPSTHAVCLYRRGCQGRTPAGAAFCRQCRDSSRHKSLLPP